MTPGTSQTHSLSLLSSFRIFLDIRTTFGDHGTNVSDEIDQKRKNTREESKRMSLRCPGSHLECQKSFMVVVVVGGGGGILQL